MVPQESEEAAGEREAVSRIQGLGWGDGLHLKGFAKPQKEVPHPASPEVGRSQAP